VETLAGVAAAVAAAAVSGAAAVAAAVADVDAAGSFFIYLRSLTKGVFRRKYRCFEAPKILLISHRSGTGAL
jgi:hypothetical protein